MTTQIKEWSGAFGRAYTDRNDLGLEGIEQFYITQFAIGRRELNRIFLSELPRTLSILEIGCNVGNQLAFLAEMDFTHLTGLDAQHYALIRARQRLSNVLFIQSSALALPFADHSFDLVFTSGVLIHIHPDHLPIVLAEIHRVTRSWIWGLEYYADIPSEVTYRGQSNLLWKAPFSQLYQQQFPNLKLVREQFLVYKKNSNNLDAMYLLRKPHSTDHLMV